MAVLSVETLARHRFHLKLENYNCVITYINIYTLASIHKQAAKDQQHNLFWVLELFFNKCFLSFKSEQDFGRESLCFRNKRQHITDWTLRKERRYKYLLSHFHLSSNSILDSYLNQESMYQSLAKKIAYLCMKTSDFKDHHLTLEKDPMLSISVVLIFPS